MFFHRIIAITALVAAFAAMGAACRPESKVYPFGTSADTIAYLESHTVQPSFGGKVFCEYSLLGTDDTSKEYVSALCQEQYVKNGAIEAGTGYATSAVLTYQMMNGQKTYTNIAMPTDANFVADVKRLFPANIQKVLLKNGVFFDATLLHDRAMKMMLNK